MLAGALRTSNIIEFEPEFPRALAVEIAHDTSQAGGGSEMAAAFGRMHREQVLRGIEQMIEAGDLADWVDAAVLAEIILLETGAATKDWALNGKSAQWLRSRCQLGACLILWGPSTGPARQRIESTVKELLTGSRRDPPRYDGKLGTAPG